MKAPPSDISQAMLRQVLAEHHRETFAWALNCCDRDRADAEDVLHASYLKILDGRARFDRRSCLRTWLFAIVRKTAAERRRRRFLRTLLLEPVALAEQITDVAPAAEDEVAQARQRTRLTGALASLPRRQREVILLVFYHELTVEAAAQVMDTGVGSARQHYARAKRRLRELLEREGGFR
jgi:RNA polymerase sigma-70 factor (ECF subfamily)